MNSEKISGRQLWFILFLMRSSIIISSLPVLTTADAGRDAWISGILVLAFSLLFIALLNSLDLRFPGQTVIEYSQKILGTVLGKIISFIILWIFLQTSLIEIRLYGELIITGFMPQTPIIFIIGGMVLTSLICIYSGIEVLGRTADFIFFIFIIMLLGIILIPLGDFDYRNLQPVLARGIQPVIRGSLVPVALISQTWVLGILNSITISSKKFKYWIPLSSIATSLIILIIIVVIVIGVIGAHEGSRATFPILTLMRSVILTRFLQRTELLIVFGWGMGLFISVSTFLYCGARGLAQWFNLHDYNPLLGPMSVLWTYMSYFSFDSMFVFYKFISPEIYAPYGLGILFLPLVLLWLGFIFRKIMKLPLNSEQ